MKRSLATAFVSVASGAVCAGKETCPCFTAAEYDKIFEANPQFGCHFTGDEYEDWETISHGVAYLWPEEQLLGVVQSAVTVREVNGSYVHGGVCAVAGNHRHLSIKNVEVRDYGDGMFSPAAFQDCVDIMKAKCETVCNALETVHGDRHGCGRMLFSSSKATN